MSIGSTVEALPVAREIQMALSHDPRVSTLWADGVFGASATTIESLEKELEQADFACPVVTADDVTASRDNIRHSPRDNVIFELGLFMGRLGRDRGFMIRPRGLDIKTPPDLYGISMIDYTSGHERELAQRLGPACTMLRRLVSQLGSR